LNHWASKASVTDSPTLGTFTSTAIIASFLFTRIYELYFNSVHRHQVMAPCFWQLAPGCWSLAPGVWFLLSVSQLPEARS
jgi:hypothetical protein